MELVVFRCENKIIWNQKRTNNQNTSNTETHKNQKKLPRVRTWIFHFKMENSYQTTAYGAVMANGSIRPSADRVSHIKADVISWMFVDGIILVVIFFGNILTILAIRLSKKLQSYTSNMFVLSLAVSDLVVGLTLPYHLVFYMGSGVGSKASTCLMRFFLIIMACTVSIWNLISIAIDRYVAIVYPLHYVR